MSETGRVGRAFLDQSSRFLTADFLPRIRVAVGRLAPEDLWWRPNERSNSVGNLLLHLAGNLGQWVVAGVGGSEDVRARREEFEARGGADAGELLARLEGVVSEAARTLDRLDPALLLERRRIQGQDVTVLYAVYHAVEHLSMHTGQILWIVKLRTGESLDLYRVDHEGVAEAAWDV